jgi:hypothetical protein
MNARADDSLSQPPLMPEGESAAADRADFAEECQASLKKLGDRVGWQLGIPLITNTKKWGAVYRVDFTMPGPDLAPFDQSGYVLADNERRADDRGIRWPAHPAAGQRKIEAV